MLALNAGELAIIVPVIVTSVVGGMVTIIREVRQVKREVTPTNTSTNGDVPQSNGETLADLAQQCRDLSLYTHARNHQFMNCLQRLELKLGLEPTDWTLTDQERMQTRSQQP